MLVLAMLVLAMDVLDILVFWEPEVTMARGMLMLRLTPSTWLLHTGDTLDTLAMVMAILVIPTPVPMDMVTLAMLVLDLAMDTPMLPPLEPAETILELLSPAKDELYLNFM